MSLWCQIIKKKQAGVQQNSFLFCTKMRMKLSLSQTILLCSLNVPVSDAFTANKPLAGGERHANMFEGCNDSCQHRQSLLLHEMVKVKDPTSASVPGEGDVNTNIYNRNICQAVAGRVSSFVTSFGFACVIMMTNSMDINGNGIANAADYGSLTDEQKAVAEAWRVVDNSFLDRTFNGKDWFAIRQDAVRVKYKSSDEAQDAIEKMVGKLGDKYTRYLSPAKYQSLVNSATGTLAGVGIELNVNKDGKVIASDVEAASPASNGGIKPRDIFVEVDGQRFETGATPDEVANRLRGPEGSKVGVVMERDGKTLDFILTRAKIKVTSVKTYLSDKAGVGKVGVIRIKSFSGTTASTVSDAISELKKKGAKAFVIDLRNNPGGLLPGGVETAGLFLDANKPVVFVVDKKGIVDAQETLAPGIDLEDPVVLYVNRNTASASEVMTAALKENGRVTVAGEQTFGKGIVQTIRELSNDYGGVAVTIARYETPKHNDINKQGIPVDISLSECENDDAVSCLPASAFQPPQEIN